MPVTAPGREENQSSIRATRLVHNIIDVIPVIVRWPVLHVRLHRIEIDERQMPVGIADAVAIEFGDRNRLDDSKFLPSAILKIFVRVLTIQPMK